VVGVAAVRGERRICCEGIRGRRERPVRHNHLSA
jgi:hypothetical protein